jgi:ABC-2 type transport system ATP-binding protein
LLSTKVGRLIVKVMDLVKSYGETQALRGVSLEVEKGEIFGLLGPNGAGKTTLIEIICGLRKFDEGHVTVLNIDVAKEPTKVKSLIGFCPQETLIYDLLSVRENLAFAASLQSLSSKEFNERVSVLSDFLGLKDVMKKRIRELSGGMRRRVSLAASIIHDPPILILDEPTVGFDPNARREFWSLVQRLHKEDKTILLSTHYMEEADELCSRVAIIDEGKIVALNEPTNLKKKFGGTSLVHVRVKRAQIRAAIKLLDAFNPLLKDEELRISVKNPWEVLPEITANLSSHGVLVEKVEVVEPTLEDVFINLTGRRLTAGEES